MRHLCFALFATMSLLACSSDDTGVRSPYGASPDATTVIGAAGATVVGGSASCVPLPSGGCAEAKTCAADERRDVVLDASGKVATVVCYPASATPTQVEASGNVDLAKTANNGVVALDGAADGIDIAGNVTSAANNVVVYGEGPAVSVIGGNVTASGNGFALRGVTVKGDVHVTGNNAALVLCVIEGNVELEGNNNVIADCAVHGSITVRGVNSVLVRNDVGAELSVADTKNTICEGNVTWNDADEDRIVDDGETGATLACAR